MLNRLPKVSTRSDKRLGRGTGSGKGKTAGRGTKGQKARGSVPVGFSGSGLPLYKKLPLKRGWGNTHLTSKFTTLNLSALNIFKDKTVVDIEKLIEVKLINKKAARKGVKILGNGEINSVLTIKIATSASAKKEIEKKGGKVLDV